MNHLAAETSPYLLQHRDNPVDWYPWERDALDRARAEDKPLLVSVGYSACHWCHVMAHESFEDPEVAALMNANFVCVKVDREERPDVDAVLMEACQALHGHGGWPLNVFLTPEQKPFFAGTYFPPEPRTGMPSWSMVLNAITETWRERPASVRDEGTRIAQAIAGESLIPQPTEVRLPATTIADAVTALQAGFDRTYGGFGANAPKFPAHSTLELLLAAGERDMSLHTLRQMAAGGIYDHVGGGFARYSVDRTWTVPHFEKMLYDNALLARVYLHGWQVSGEQRFKEVCTDTLDWALREMRGPEGGFYAALDADSEGVEGKYYVWTVAQLHAALGDELAQAAIDYFGVTERGNFEGTNVLRTGRAPAPARLPEIRARLLEARGERVRPGTDDKRLTAWNALMVAALADAGAVLERDDYIQAARGCADFILTALRDQDGKLLRTWKDGEGRLAAYLEDHAYLLQALLVLYEATFEERWYLEATQLADAMMKRFGDPEQGGFFTTARDQPHLITRRKDMEDSPTPAGNSAAAYGLLRLARFSGSAECERQAVGVLALHGEMAVRHPAAFSHLLLALDFYAARVSEVAIIGEAGGAGAGPLTRAVQERFRPHVVLAGRQDTSAATAVPLLEGRHMLSGEPAAYVCEHFTCQLPVTAVAELAAALDRR